MIITTVRSVYQVKRHNASPEQIDQYSITVVTLSIVEASVTIICGMFIRVLPFRFCLTEAQYAANLATYEYGPLKSCALWLWGHKDGKKSGKDLYDLQFPRRNNAGGENIESHAASSTSSERLLK